MVNLTKEQAETALRLLTAYANSGVPDDVSLECARVCGALRAGLAQEGQPIPDKASSGMAGIPDKPTLEQVSRLPDHWESLARVDRAYKRTVNASTYERCARELRAALPHLDTSQPPGPTPDCCRLCGGTNGLHWPGCIVLAGAE